MIPGILRAKKIVNLTSPFFATLKFAQPWIWRARALLSATVFLFLALGTGTVAADAALCKQTWMSENLHEAFNYCSRAAAQGDTEAQQTLGLMYHFGEGVVQDYSVAALFYSLAAKKGDLISQVNLGVLYQTGRGVQQSDVAAFMWYTVASATGWSVALDHRGRIGGRMTDWQISEGEARAKRCISSRFTRC